MDLENTQTSRNRMLLAGKSLFARLGYEQTSTATIAREAATSESQLVRYFGGKAGLLEAIFNESWAPLNQNIAAVVAQAPDPKRAIASVLAGVIESFGKDHELAFLFLFEGRRVRSQSHEVILSKGFIQFYELICDLIQKGQKDGTIRSDLAVPALSSALMGAAEGMIRDRLVAERSGKPNPFTDEELKAVFDAIMDAV